MNTINCRNCEHREENDGADYCSMCEKFIMDLDKCPKTQTDKDN